MSKKFFIVIIYSSLLLLSHSAKDLWGADGVIVKVRKAEYTDIHVKHEFTGVIQAVQAVEIKPEIAAKIAKVHFQEGSFVKSGQTLFTLESSQYNAAVQLRKAELQSSEANLDRARKYLSRLKAADKRSVPASDMDTAEANVKQAQASVAVSKANLETARINFGYTKITAPISGLIGRAEFTKGNYINQNSTLAKIVQINPVRAAVDIPDKDYVNFKNNDYIASIQGYKLTGEHEFDDNSVNQSTGTVKTWWSFENPDNNLIPGASVHVDLSLRVPQKGILIPKSAKVSANNNSYVYVIKNNTAHYTKIIPGHEIGDMLEVTGIDPNDLIAVEGLQKLFDNAPVNIQE